MRKWILTVLALGTTLLVSGALGVGPGLSTEIQRQGARHALWVGGALLALAALVAVRRRRIGRALDGLGGSDLPSRVEQHPYLTLFLVSFVALFVELTVIRYAGSQVRIFGYYKNVPLIAAFLGLGLGAWLGNATRATPLRFLLWVLPFAAFFAQGTVVLDGLLDAVAARGTTEHILGGGAISGPTPAWITAVSRAAMAAVCVAVLLVTALLFVWVGRLLGAAFEDRDRLPAYAVNLAGSLAGILAFILLSRLETPPGLWFTVGLAPMLWWIAGARERIAAGALVVAVALVVTPQVGDTVWSRYQKLVGYEVSLADAAGTQAEETGYLVQISNVFYQVAIDLSRDGRAGVAANIYPHQDSLLRGLERRERVLVVGAGTGNDVAAALRSGAGRVDAVEIDPAIVRMGREHHPERPYADRRVRVIVDDARAAFRDLPEESYDAVVFGLLDSHTQLGVSSLRLDNYVYTRESFSEARELLRPGGHFVVTAVTLQPWMRDRIEGLLETVCSGTVITAQYGPSGHYRCAVGAGEPGRGELASAVSLPTDDWPFFYLPERTIPAGYLVVILVMALASIQLLREKGVTVASWTAARVHFFLLGAAFLLMEVYAINRLALLFGTTWLVSAIAIAAVLTLALIANFVVIAFPRVRYAIAYAGIALTLLAGYALSPSVAVGGSIVQVTGYVTLLVSPVFFAGIVFARSFAASVAAGPAIGANILGSVFGGLLEYATMATGIKAMALMALALYAASATALWLHRRAERRVSASPRPSASPSPRSSAAPGPGSAG